MSVSVRYLVNAGWVRNGDVRVAIPADAGSPARCALSSTPNAASTAATCSSVVISSQATDT